MPCSAASPRCRQALQATHEAGEEAVRARLPTPTTRCIQLEVIPTEYSFIIEDWVEDETRQVFYRIVHQTTGQVYADKITSIQIARRLREDIEDDIGIKPPEKRPIALDGAMIRLRRSCDELQGDDSQSPYVVRLIADARMLLASLEFAGIRPRGEYSVPTQAPDDDPT